MSGYETEVTATETEFRRINAQFKRIDAELTDLTKIKLGGRRILVNYSSSSESESEEGNADGEY